jgi:hypothetical protein
VNRINYIKKFSVTIDSKYKLVLLNGLLWCLSSEELEKLFDFFIKQNVGVRRIFFSRILKDKSISINIKLSNHIIEIIDEIDEYPKRESVSKFLFDLASKLELDDAIIIFRKLILSKFRNDRKRAINMLAKYELYSEIYYIEKSWLKYEDERLIKFILYNSSEKFILKYQKLIEEIFEEYDEEDLMAFFNIKILRNKYLSRTMKVNEEKIIELKDTDPISYLYIMKEANKKVEMEYAIKNFGNPSAYRHFLPVWFAKMNMWDTLVKLSNTAN